MPLKNNRSNLFRRWLTKKHLSYADFSDKPGIQYKTVQARMRGAQPKKLSQKFIKTKFPDCPLLK